MVQLSVQRHGQPGEVNDSLHTPVEDHRAFDEPILEEVRPHEMENTLQDWIITFPLHGTYTGEENRFCQWFFTHQSMLQNLSNGCHNLGHPDETGITSVRVHATLEEVKDVVRARHLDAAHVEHDAGFQIMSHEPDDRGQYSATLWRALDVSPRVTHRVLHDVTWGLDRLDQAHGLDGSFSDANWGLNTSVFVFDTGIDFDLPEFEGRVIPLYQTGSLGKGACFPAQKGCSHDLNGHGTMVATNIASRDRGVAPDSHIYSVRVTERDGTGRFSDLVEALDFVMLTHTQHAGVVVMSVAGPGHSVFVHDAFTKATEHKLTIVVAAGNMGEDACKFQPARLDEVITVAAIDRNDNKADFSNWGDCIDIFAPGVDVETRTRTGQIVNASGTSIAASFVAGYAAQYEGVIYEDVTHVAMPIPLFVKDALLASANHGAVHNPRGGTNRLLYTRKLKPFFMMAGQDGRISEDELAAFLSPQLHDRARIHNYFLQADLDGTGFLEYKEFFDYTQPM